MTAVAPRLPRLARRLTLEAPVLAPDGAGGFARGWSALGTLFAEVERGAARVTAQPGGGESRRSLRITVRGAAPGAPSRPQPGQRFREGARLYPISAVSEADAQGRFLLCLAHEESTL